MTGQETLDAKMNILLTEIRSLNLDLTGLPEAAPDTASSFTRLFQQQLPGNLESDNQVIDYNGIYAEFEMPLEAPAATLEIPQASAWREYLAQDPVRVSSDIGPLQATPVNLEPVTNAALAQAPLPAAIAQSPVGELLPPGGKTLPDADLAPPVPAIDRVQTGAAATAPARVPNPQSMAAAINFTVPAGMRDAAVAEPSAQMPQQATIPAAAADAARSAAPRAVIEKPVIAAATVASPSAPPAVEPVVQRATAAPALPGGDSGQQAQLNSAAGTPAARPAPVKPQPVADARPVPAPLAAATRSATVFDPGQPEQRNPVNAEVSVARAAAPAENPAERAGMNPERWPAMAKPPADVQAARPAAVTAEMTAAGELRDSPRIQLTQPASQPLESGLTQNPAVRTAEPMPNVTAPPAPATGVALPAAVTPLTTAQVIPGPGEALPPQLELLQLSRQADGNDWGNGLGERVQWMINQKQNSAMIRLDPPALGKLDVQVKIAEDSTTITIQTQHAQTRDLIETASHRLRDFLQESGYQNVNVDVSQRHDQQQARAQTAPGSGDEAGADADAEQDIDDARTEPGQGYLQGDGLLDTFA